MQVGNCYVNRNQIGAVVGVQPFGGEGLSGTGPKAGGPHYLLKFASERTLTVNTTAAGGNASLADAGRLSPGRPRVPAATRARRPWPGCVPFARAAGYLPTGRSAIALLFGVGPGRTT